MPSQFPGIIDALFERIELRGLLPARLIEHRPALPDEDARVPAAPGFGVHVTPDRQHSTHRPRVVIAQDAELIEDEQTPARTPETFEHLSGFPQNVNPSPPYSRGVHRIERDYRNPATDRLRREPAGQDRFAAQALTYDHRVTHRLPPPVVFSVVR